MRSYQCIIALATGLLSGLMTDAGALILYDANSTSNTKNVIDPANSATFPSSAASGAPWQYVIRYGVNNASAVYIGNGYLLTARHVSTSDSGLLIQGVSYNRDTSFPPLPLTIPGSPVIAIDLQLQKITGDPGLLPLPLAVPSDSDLNKTSVLVGWGVGKGSAISQGWNWGDDTTRAFRWGTNTTAAGTQTVNSGSGNYTAISASFNSTAGANEAAGTLGDSGSALFQLQSTVWKLSGLTTAVSNPGASRYSFLSPDVTYFARLKEYSWILRFDAWKAKHGIAQTTPGTDDSDGDGIPLLTEYALGLDPAIASTDGLPVVSVSRPNLVLIFRRMASATDIKIEVETSSTLQSGDWTVETPVIAVLDGTSVFQTIKASVPLGSGDRKFARLKITKL